MWDLRVISPGSCKSILISKCVPAPIFNRGAPEAEKSPSDTKRRARFLPAQLVEQCLGLLEIGRTEALDEPTVDGRQQRTGFGLLALLLPQVRQAQRRPELPGLGLLAAGKSEGLLEAVSARACWSAACASTKAPCTRCISAS